MKLRTFIFWPHVIAGVVAGVVILMMSVTGVLLTYERQMVAWADANFRSTVPSGEAARLTPEEFLTRWTAAHPDLAPTAITVNADRDMPIAVAVPQRTLYADAYSGALLGEQGRSLRPFMSSVRAWHRWFAVDGENRPVARFVTGWSNLLFLLLVMSGMYLWLPRVWKWTTVKAVLFFRSNASGKARDFNWHNVIGVWSAIPLIIVVGSALPMSFPWANALVYRAVGEAPPAGRDGGGREGGARQGGAGRAGGAGREGGPPREARGERGPRPEGGDRAAVDASGERREAGRQERREGGEGGSPRRQGARSATLSTDRLDVLLARAEQQVPDWKTINLRLPEQPDAPVVFAIDRGDGGQPHLRSTLTLNRATGDVVRYEAFSDLTLGRRIRNVMRFAHTGEVLGIPGQTIAGLVSAGGAVLVWTGMALAWRRYRAWMTRRSIAVTTVPNPSRSSAA